jgi:hypothetical protein
VRADGWTIGNVDCVLVAQQPKIALFLPAMKASIARLLTVEEARVNLRGKQERDGRCGSGTGHDRSCCRALHREKRDDGDSFLRVNAPSLWTYGETARSFGSNPQAVFTGVGRMLSSVHVQARGCG